MNELIELNAEQIVIQQGFIEWSQFEDLKAQALELAENIRAVNVDPENIKESKRLLAQVNKRCKELDSRRIKIKNAMLEPYQVFETQVKEIVGIVKEADEIVRQQVKQLEEEERQEKRQQIKTLFDLRLKHYSFRDLFSFEDFEQPRHLNKTVSIDMVENEIIDYLEKLTKDLKAIESMPNAKDILSLYIESKDLAAALTKQAQQMQRKEQIEKAQAFKEKDLDTIGLWEFSVYDEKDAKLLEMFLQQNKIKYTLEEF